MKKIDKVLIAKILKYMIIGDIFWVWAKSSSSLAEEIITLIICGYTIGLLFDSFIYWAKNREFTFCFMVVKKSDINKTKNIKNINKISNYINNDHEIILIVNKNSVDNELDLNEELLEIHEKTKLVKKSITETTIEIRKKQIILDVDTELYAWVVNFE